MDAPRDILIAGLGNLLLSDDGVGVHAVRELERTPMVGVVVAEIGTAVLHGLPLMEKASRVLLIDAARGGGAPGTVYLFDEAEDAPAGAPPSMHAMGLREAARVLGRGGPRPRVTVIGVEPGDLECGLELSAPVRAALPRVVALARATAAGWLDKRAPEAGTPAVRERMTSRNQI